MAHKRANACLRAPSQLFRMYDSSVRRVFTAGRHVSWFGAEAENFESLHAFSKLSKKRNFRTWTDDGMEFII